MKPSTWNILTVAVIVLWLVLAIVVLIIFTNPNSNLNPFRVPTLPPTLTIPTSTATLRKLPPTWTPTIAGTHLVPTMTMPPTGTGFVLPTFTSTPTNTSTPTRTPTRTRTPTITRTPTNTLIPTATKNLTATALSNLATEVAQTQQAATATADCAATQAAGGTCP